MFADEKSPLVSDLRRRLEAFYESVTTYSAFQRPSHIPERWCFVDDAIRSMAEAGCKCRVLEIGAGRTGFASWAGGARGLFHFTVQDVTGANEEFLRSQADTIHIGSLLDLEGPYDIIFSTFVFEHVSDPRRTLDKLFDLLNEGGEIFIFCPRFDFPFYLSHSADHYSASTRLWLGCVLLWRRFWSRVMGKPLFLIHTDPAVFHTEWRMDRDAIHWVSLSDIQTHFKGRARIRTMKVKSPDFWDRFVKNHLQVNVCIKKPS